MNIKHWYGTLAKYNAVATKDSGTLYHCSEGLIYRGSVLLATKRWGDLSGKPSTFAPSAHTHSYLPLTGGSISGSIQVSTKVTTGGYNYSAQTAGVGIGADGLNNGVTFYNGTGITGRIYRISDVMHFNRGGDTSKGFSLTAAGLLTHGGNFSVLGDVTSLLKLTAGLQSTGGKVSIHNTTYSFAEQSDRSLEVHSDRITSKSSDIGLPGLIVDTFSAEGQTYGADMLFDVQKTTGGAFSDLSKPAFVFSTNWFTHLLKIFRGGDVVVGGSIGTSTADGASVRIGLTRILYDSSIAGVHFMKNTGGYSPIRAGAITANGEMQATGFYQTSLRSAKRDIKFFDQSALEVIRGVDVVSYRYKAQTDDETHIGYIADDTHELLSGKKHDHANQGNAIGLLIKAVQELEKQNKVLLDQVKSLQS